MKAIKTLKSAIFVYVLIVASFAQKPVGAITFVGYMKKDTSVRFSLIDTVEKVSSSWLKIGETFRGVTVEGFDSQNEILTVRSEGSLIRLPMVVPTIKEAKVGTTRPIIVKTMLMPNGELEYDGKLIRSDELRDRLCEVARNNPHCVMSIKGVKQLSDPHVVALLSALQFAGIHKFVFESNASTQSAAKQ